MHRPCYYTAHAHIFIGINFCEEFQRIWRRTEEFSVFIKKNIVKNNSIENKIESKFHKCSSELPNEPYQQILNGIYNLNRNMYQEIHE